MNGTALDFEGVRIVIYILENGEKIPKHKHKGIHGHLVVRGRTRLEIDGREPLELKLHDANIELPANVDHQVTALEDGTVFLHISKGNPNDP